MAQSKEMLTDSLKNIHRVKRQLAENKDEEVRLTNQYSWYQHMPSVDELKQLFGLMLEEGKSLIVFSKDLSANRDFILNVINAIENYPRLTIKLQNNYCTEIDHKVILLQLYLPNHRILIQDPMYETFILKKPWRAISECLKGRGNAPESLVISSEEDLVTVFHLLNGGVFTNGLRLSFRYMYSINFAYVLQAKDQRVTLDLDHHYIGSLSRYLEDGCSLKSLTLNIQGPQNSPLVRRKLMNEVLSICLSINRPTRCAINFVSPPLEIGLIQALLGEKPSSALFLQVNPINYVFVEHLIESNKCPSGLQLKYDSTQGLLEHMQEVITSPYCPADLCFDFSGFSDAQSEETRNILIRAGLLAREEKKGTIMYPSNFTAWKIGQASLPLAWQRDQASLPLEIEHDLDIVKELMEAGCVMSGQSFKYQRKLDPKHMEHFQVLFSLRNWAPDMGLDLSAHLISQEQCNLLIARIAIHCPPGLRIILNKKQPIMQAAIDEQIRQTQALRAKSEAPQAPQVTNPLAFHIEEKKDESGANDSISETINKLDHYIAKKKAVKKTYASLHLGFLNKAVNKVKSKKVQVQVKVEAAEECKAFLELKHSHEQGLALKQSHWDAVHDGKFFSNIFNRSALLKEHSKLEKPLKKLPSLRFVLPEGPQGQQGQGEGGESRNATARPY